MVTGRVHCQVQDTKEGQTSSVTMGTFQTRGEEQILCKALHYAMHV